MATPRCWARLPNATRCPAPARPGPYYCEDHGLGSGPHPCNIWRGPLAEMPPDLVAAIRLHSPGAVFPDSEPGPPAPPPPPPPAPADPAQQAAAPSTLGPPDAPAAAPSGAAGADAP